MKKAPGYGASPVLVTVTVQVTVSPALTSLGVPLLSMRSEGSGVTVPQSPSQVESAGPVTALRSTLSPAGGLPTVTL